MVDLGLLQVPINFFCYEPLFHFIAPWVCERGWEGTEDTENLLLF